MAASIPQANGSKSQVLIKVPASKLPTSPSPCHYGSSALFSATSVFPLSGALSQMQPRTCLRSVSSRQIWPVILACWGPSSNTSAVPSSLLSSANLIHMLSAALAKPLIKMTRKERSESRARRPCLLSATSAQLHVVPDTLSGPCSSSAKSLYVQNTQYRGTHLSLAGGPELAQLTSSRGTYVGDSKSPEPQTILTVWSRASPSLTSHVSKPSLGSSQALGSVDLEANQTEAYAGRDPESPVLVK